MESLDSEELVDELLARSELVVELDGPQVEAWVSGLFAVFDDALPATEFAAACASRRSVASRLVCMAMAELARGLDQRVVDAAEASAVLLGDVDAPGVDQIGQSVATAAWLVEAPFGRSVVLGFENPIADAAATDDDPSADHAVLVELDPSGHVHDLQLTGGPDELVREAAEAGPKVTVRDLTIERAAQMICEAWPAQGVLADGPGIDANQQFVRRRLLQLTGAALDPIEASAGDIDIRRGLDDEEFAEANRAALSTLTAAVGTVTAASSASPELSAWVGVIHGNGGDLTQRERAALLWLEWADWLGAGIGLLRADATTTLSGAAMVDFVNRCPEVSSSIEKADRDYAEWAFEVAIEVLVDAGVVGEDRALTGAGRASLGPALATAWGEQTSQLGN